MGAAQAQQKFTSDQCLKSVFKTEVTHSGKFFGLIENNLKIEKDNCQILLSFKNILTTQWNIDICREPIHMKVTSKGSQNVYKRRGDCSGRSSDYCSYWQDLDETIQDYGLIFAEGARENLDSDHGKVYCAYLLVNKYLKTGHLFSKFEKSVGLFPEVHSLSKESMGSTPAKQPELEVKANSVQTTDAPTSAEDKNEEEELRF